MAIKKIHVKNFKSFRDVEVELGPLNVFIGANASGKSNFVSIFEFLNNATVLGLGDAVSLSGGIEYLRNLNIGHRENISIHIENEPGKTRLFHDKDETSEFRIKKRTYEFSIKSDETKSDFQVTQERIEESGEWETKSYPDDHGWAVPKSQGIGSYSIERNSGKSGLLTRTTEGMGISLEAISGYYDALKDEEISKEKLLLTYLPLFFWTESIVDLLGDIGIYDCDDGPTRTGTSIKGRLDSEPTADNLPLVLKKILEDKEKKRSFINLTSFLLPHVKDVISEAIGNKHLTVGLREQYTKNQVIPAHLISEGTIMALALVVALYFEKKSIIVIEEPDQGFHPNLISGVMEMMKEVSQWRQIILTTHNPILLRHCDLNSIYLVSRDREGFSTITKPHDDEEVQAFLKNDLRIDDLFVDGIL